MSYSSTMKYILLLALLCGVIADRDLNICTEESTSCGPIPPALPNSFIMKSLVVDHQSKQFKWEEEYFDPDNYRGKFVEVLNGQERNYLFDYQLDTITTYTRLHPGAPINQDVESEFICVANDLSNSPARLKMGYKFGRYSTKKNANMYSSNEALAFGGPHKFAYNNDTTNEVSERGIKANAFIGCVYDQYADKTVLNKFYWSKDLFTGSGAKTAPVRVESKGKINIENLPVDIHTTTDIVWFEENPQMPNEIFQVPPRINCNVDRSVKPIPRLPPYFSTRIESIVTVEDFHGVLRKLAFDSYEEHWFDYELQLVRRDFYPSDLDIITLNFPEKGVPLSAVYDFNTGLAYYTDKTYGVCHINKITGNELFTKVNSTDETVSLNKANDVYELNDDLYYKGQYIVRNIKTDAWIGSSKKIEKDGHSAFREVYFTTEGFHLDFLNEDKYSVPLRMTEVKPGDFHGQESNVVVVSNFYNFATTKPKLSFYDIAGCVENLKQRLFSFDFDDKYHDAIMNNKLDFLDNARILIKEKADLESILRVQDIDLVFDNTAGKFRVTFTILDVLDIKGDVADIKKGVDLNTAVRNLKKSIDGKEFIIKIKPFTLEIIATEKSMKEIDPATNKFKEVANKAMPQPKNDAPVLDPSYVNEYELPSNYKTIIERMNSAPINWLNSPMAAPASEKGDDGYSSGSVAGLAIGNLIVGILAGIGIMWYYVRRSRNNGSTETANFGLES